MNPYQAGTALGQLIFGGDSSNPQAAAKGAYLGSRVRANLDAARLSRAKSIAREGQTGATQRLGDVARALGLDDAAADWIGTIAQAAPTTDPTQLGALLPQIGAFQAARGGNDAQLNRYDSAFTGKPLPLSDTSGGITTANPFTAPEVSADPIGEATIDKLGAMASQYRAGAAKNQSHAHLYDVQSKAGGWNPNSGSHKGNKLPSATTIKGILPAASLGVFATPEQKAAQEASAQHDVSVVQHWLAAHPGTTLRDYMTQGPVGSPGTIDPAGTMAIPESLQNIHHPQTKADFDALPSGASYIDPNDGQLYRKP